MSNNGELDAVVIICVGRLMFTQTADCLFETLRRLGLPHVKNSSPYWEQSIQAACETALKAINPRTGKPHKYLLFFDGDSVWTDQDLIEMYKLIDQNPGIHAIVPVQADRNSNKPLAFSWLSETGMVKYNYHGPITQIIHGHFGMTLVRSEAFHKMRKPWFFSTPNDDGSWNLGPNKRDPDTNFWLRFREAGLMVWQANQTVVGHMELMVRWQRGAEVVCQTLYEYATHGRPYGLRTPFEGELTPDEMARLPGGAPNPHAQPKKEATELPPEPQPVGAGTPTPPVETNPPAPPQDAVVVTATPEQLAQPVVQ